MTNLIWFREDLRLYDNLALYHASKEGMVAAVYIICPSMWKNHDMAACRVEFILAGLEQLKQDLLKKNIALRTIKVNSLVNIPKTLYNYATKIKATSLYFNRQYEVNKTRRDALVKACFEKHKLAVKIYDDQCLFQPGTIKNKQGEDFKVFTPFKKLCLSTLHDIHLRTYSVPRKQNAIIGDVADIPSTITGFTNKINIKQFPAGEKAANKRLQLFLNEKITDYAKQRDFPAIDGTSKLSPYLAAGMISIRQCFHGALQFNHGELYTGNLGALTWMSELLWREFYKHILVAFPRVSKHQPFKLETTKLKWETNKDHLIAWQQGKTGYPIVDAAMRQLNETAWMHNRLRMIVAMFLAKSLFLDWRLGEKYFMSHLIDGDLAANNGGWQWCASTGVDAVPYFRIFNPVTQSQRFDPNGDFIRQFCPELETFDNKAIHNPYGFDAEKARKNAYPSPIINHKTARQRTLARFKALKKTS